MMEEGERQYWNMSAKSYICEVHWYQSGILKKNQNTPNGSILGTNSKFLNYEFMIKIQEILELLVPKFSKNN